MASPNTPPTKTTAIVCIGMAGSGKTTFMQRINSYLHTQRTPPYVINLDPAVRTVPFESNIDIRESIDYKEVMKQYNLGPNGGILTSLNLFATKVDQILEILERRCGITGIPSSSSAEDDAPTTKTSTTEHPPSTPEIPPPPQPPITHILLDTPGQIEVFVWSASGQILLSSIASTFPTVIAYIIDTPRTISTSTFMSNMLYACSILYKTKLPMILVFNKTDVQDAEFAKEWMTDFEAFQAALQKEEEGGAGAGVSGGNGDAPYGGAMGGGGSGYMSSLLNSMSLVLDEFYRHLSVVGVSAMTGSGIPEFFAAVEEKRQEFERDYRPELERRKQERERERDGRKEMELGRLMADLNVENQSRRGMMGRDGDAESGLATAAGAGAGVGAASRQSRKPEPETISDLEDNERDEDDDDDDYGFDDQPVRGDGDADDDDGLSARYQRALGGEAGGRAGDDGLQDDMSFARYIRKSNMNG